MLRRLAALVAVVTLSAGNVAICAGWQATPEARMACCLSGTTCPMHKSASHNHASTTALSQAQADSCCAAATERRDSPAASSTFIVLNEAARPAAAALFIVPVSVAALQVWRALVPLPPSAVPKHLLLSVLLV
jgi:hypothetical protein